MSEPLIVCEEPHDATLGTVGLMLDRIEMDVISEELDGRLNNAPRWRRAGTEWQDIEDGIFPTAAVQVFTNRRGKASCVVGGKPDRRPNSRMIDKQCRATPVTAVAKVNVVNHASPVSDKRGWPWLIIVVAITVIIVIIEKVVTTAATAVGQQWGYLVQDVRPLEYARGPCVSTLTPQLATQRGEDLRQRVEFRIRGPGIVAGQARGKGLLALRRRCQATNCPQECLGLIVTGASPSANAWCSAWTVAHGIMRGTALPKTAQPPFHTVGRSTGILIVAVTLVAFVHRPCLNPKSNAHPTGL